MLSASTSPVLNALVVIGVGLFTTLMAFGIVPASLDARRARQWRARWGSGAKIGGPLVMVAGLALLARAWFQP